MRSLADLPGLVRVGRRPLGEEWWLRGGDLGSTVRAFDDPAHLPAYVGLHEEAHLWVHRDFDHDAWHVLDVDEPAEVGADFAAMKRRAGVMIRMFYPDATDDPVPPPTDRLELLHGVLDKLCDAAANDLDRFLSQLVRARVRALDGHVVYSQSDRLFFIDDLDPSPEEMAAWQAVTLSPSALTSFPIAWEPTGDGSPDLPCRARVGGRILTIRLNELPARPRYTLIADGQELEDLHGWPPAWDDPPTGAVPPAPPKRL
jgi:hypothetical protein